MDFILQVQTSSTVQEALWSIGYASFSEATERSEVWQEDT